jgi:hypothetical protein
LQAGHLKLGNHQAAVYACLHRQADDTAAEQIEDHRQIKPAFRSGNLGDIARPRLALLINDEIAIQKVRCNGERVFAFPGRSTESSRATRLNAMALNQ